MSGDARVFVDFYDYVNVGDDLLFRTLAERYPHRRFAYLADKGDGSAFADLPNVRRLRRIRYVDGVLRRLRIPVRVNDLRRRWLLRRSPLVIRLGGSLYMEQGDWRRNVQRDTELVDGAGKVFFLNGNFGPWRTREFLTTYERIFSRASDVTVRDSASREQLAAVPQVRLAPDMLFTVPGPEPAAPRSGVVVSLIDLTGREGLARYRDAYEEAMAHLLEDLVASGAAPVTLVSFCPTEGDEAAVERVLARIQQPAAASVATHCYRGDLAAVLALLRGADTVVATRFHAMVLGLAFGSAVCCVEYSGKVSNALADLGAAGHGWKLADFVAASRTERLERVMAAGPLAIPGVVEQAAGHFAVLDEHLAQAQPAVNVGP